MTVFLKRLTIGEEFFETEVRDKRPKIHRYYRRMCVRPSINQLFYPFPMYLSTQKATMIIILMCRVLLGILVAVEQAVKPIVSHTPFLLVETAVFFLIIVLCLFVLNWFGKASVKRHLGKSKDK